MNPKLSICIPTYNRATYLAEAIQSIVSQPMEDVEIVICDNASTDSTDELIQSLKNTYPNIVYYKWERNMGPDTNYLKVVEVASGEYCWLMGSDDALKVDSVRKVMEQLRLGKDIYLCNRTECDENMHPLKDRHWLRYGKQLSFDFINHNDILAYLNRAESLGALFSYLSSIIVKRSKWNQITYDPSYTGTAYSHVYILLSMVKAGCNLQYLDESLVYCRGGNDTFTGKSLAKRIMIDLHGYGRLASELFQDKLDIRDAIIRVLERECNHLYFTPFYRVLKIRTFSDSEDWEDVMRTSSRLFGRSLRLELLGRIIVSKRLATWLLTLHRKVRTGK